MKKALLLIISLFVPLAVLAYQTVLIDFPENENWHQVYYQTQGLETILQYVPDNQTAQNWTRTLVFHSYRHLNQTTNAAAFMNKTITALEAKNSSSLYKYTKYSNTDAMATRCVQKNALVPTQCEIYRVSNSFESLITMHYINKNIADYKDNYDQWYDIMQNIRIYYNYYREDRILDKATTFEL